MKCRSCAHLKPAAPAMIKLGFGRCKDAPSWQSVSINHDRTCSWYKEISEEEIDKRREAWMLILNPPKRAKEENEE